MVVESAFGLYPLDQRVATIVGMHHLAQAFQRIEDVGDVRLAALALELCGERARGLGSCGQDRAHDLELRS